MSERMDEDYILTHLGEDPERHLGAVSTPVYQTASFTAGHEYEYSRGDNPNFDVIEKKIAALDRTERAVFTSCGVSAAFDVFSTVLKAGDHVVAVKSVYPGTRRLLNDAERFGITYTLVSCGDTDELFAAVRPNTKLIYLESPSSMVLELQDIGEIAREARRRGILTAIDNNCATPLFQKPADLGIDLIIYSATKYFGGHSDALGGFISGSGELIGKIRENRDLYGLNNSPANAWLIERGLKTLSLRLKRHGETALKLAEYLEKHPAIKEVNYPALKSFPQRDLYLKQMTGCGGLFSIKTVGTPEQNEKFVNSLRVFTRASSWGGHESLVYPFGAVKPFEKQISRDAFHGGVIRMFAGLEDADALLEDLENALKVFE